MHQRCVYVYTGVYMYTYLAHCSWTPLQWPRWELQTADVTIKCETNKLTMRPPVTPSERTLTMAITTPADNGNTPFDDDVGTNWWRPRFISDDIGWSYKVWHAVKSRLFCFAIGLIHTCLVAPYWGTYGVSSYSNSFLNININIILVQYSVLLLCKVHLINQSRLLNVHKLIIVSLFLLYLIPKQGVTLIVEESLKTLLLYFYGFCFTYKIGQLEPLSITRCADKYILYCRTCVLSS